MRYVNDRPPPDTLRPGPRLVMAPLPPKPPKALQPKQRRVYQVTLDEHCHQEAMREVDCWLTGERFVPREWKAEFVEAEPLGPLDFFELVK